MDVFNTLMVD